eukprot:CAMPEP_0117013936 /NCGR_PEP_ID=MMETSP0472-20121206/11407_1 /TAXON_ID=693140 ORGANISM="Tiarina fusus, Strain LIS" /NCGR_SAMPLE_ID=MMETSP0472 /ASSEMBLY_ACC=CAM_ASM_000603 /LENGTH=529 /DNA_ID=CAMNT_0004717385 /DNA_START=126 /DNA_END=1715 /DNA_ORIENTATION=-
MRQPTLTFTPPIVGRALSVVQNTVYDTWSFFDSKAKPTLHYDGVSKRSGSDGDISDAISVAAWRTLRYVYQDMAVRDYVEKETDALLLEITGLENPTSRNEKSPVGLANVIADKMLPWCDIDGANCLGSSPFTRPLPDGTTAFEDYTNYAPTNSPLVVQDFTSEEDCSKINIDRWQPLTTPTELDGSGSTTQIYFTPHMSNVRGFALESSSEFRARGPPVFGLENEGRVSFKDQHDEVLEISSTLNDREKFISEYWLPTLEFGSPPNHFMFFGMNALIAEKRNLKDSVQLLMALANSQFDAGIGAWDTKRFYDSSRPITAIRCMHTGETVRSWAGPYQGVKEIDAGSWIPYQPITFVSPPFSEYVSGHSTFSMAGAVILEKFFGSKFVGPNSATADEGESVIEPRITDPSDPWFIDGVTNRANNGPDTVGYSPASSVTLTWNTWREAAEESGISRLYCGVHIQDGNDDGLELGDRIGEKVWAKASALFQGNVPDECESNSSFDSDSDSSSGIGRNTFSCGLALLVLFLV